MDLITSWQVALVDSWSRVWDSFLTILPAVIGAIIVFGVGLIIAYWVKKLITRALQMARLENLSRQAGIEDYFARAE